VVSASVNSLLFSRFSDRASGVHVIVKSSFVSRFGERASVVQCSVKGKRKGKEKEKRGVEGLHDATPVFADAAS